MKESPNPKLNHGQSPHAQVGNSSPESKSFPVVGIGASAGGLEAFTQLLQHLPVDTGMGFVLVQHLDPQHKSALTEILAKATAMPVREVTDALRVTANHIYIIPPNASMGIEQGVLKLHPRPKRHGAARSIDTFFESLAQDQKVQAIGVVLSGAAYDGTQGLEAIKAEGGITFAQDDSAAYDSMPRSAVASGCVDFVLSPPDIARELARIARHPCLTAGGSLPAGNKEAAQAPENRRPAGPAGPAGLARAEAQAPAAPDAGQEFKPILWLLRHHSGVDFSLYKPSTVQRRIIRRMVLNRLETIPAYTQFLRGNAHEQDALYADMLINVTSFFRNPTAFEVLQREVFPKLIQQNGEEPIRVWVTGCSTGEEAYSLVMTYLEAAGQAVSAPKLQVFATDLNEQGLNKARAGLYPKTVVQDVSPERLRRFFVEEEQGYRIAKSIREMIVFARQNLLSDPPFSRLDLISCRNLLIYLESGLQQRLIPLFHYALKPQGWLFLGASESISSFTELFDPADRKHKLFRKKAGPTPALHPHFTPRHPAMKNQDSPPPEPAGTAEALTSEFGSTAQREAERLTLNRFAPPWVLVNAEGQIFQFRGDTSPYLQPPTGRATFDLLNMTREELLFPLRSALNRAKEQNQVVRTEGVRVNHNSHTRPVAIEVVPLKNLKERCYLIYFESAEEPLVRRGMASAPPAPIPEGGPRASPPNEDTWRGQAEAAQRRVAELEHELAEARDYAQCVREQNEAAREELQASNEEITSTNEELQSINEELETSSEELESSNEELTTLNQELANRNTELREGRDFTQAILENVPPFLILDNNLRVEKANTSFYEQFKVLPAQTEQRRVYELGNSQWNIAGLRTLLEEILPCNGVVKDFEVSHTFESLGPRTMLLNAHRLESLHRILLCIVDITERKQMERGLVQAKAELETKVAERTAKLQELVGELEHFSYSITHDLRAPLRHMQCFANMLLADESAERLPPLSKDYLTRITAAAQRMDTLITDALQYSKATHSEVALKPVAVAALLRGMMEIYPNLQPPGADIRLEGEFPPVLGNEAALTQCFSNLLGNAVKFVAPGTVPKVRVWAEPRNDQVRLWFEDNGIGIPTNCQARIWDMFQQVVKTPEGTGIGLALVRKNMQRMGGKAGVESEPGKGSRFWLDFKPANT